MPGLNGTGPLGEGPMTGRAQGRCAGNKSIDDTILGFGHGLGRGMGRGRGIRQRAFMSGHPGGFYRNGEIFSPENEKEFLTREAELYRVRLKGIETRISEIDGRNSSES